MSLIFPSICPLAHHFGSESLHFVSEQDNALSILSPGKRIKETVRFEKEERSEQDDVSGVDEEEEAAEDGDGDDSWSESSEASDYENKSSIKTDSNVINVSVKKEDKVPKHPVSLHSADGLVVCESI